MYLAIDVGATKTLLAVFSKDGHLSFTYIIKTDWDYQAFLKDLSRALSTNVFKDNKISACCIAFPGRLDLKTGLGIAFGVLPWRNLPLKQDLTKLLPDLKLFMHNDAKLAALSEAKAVDKKFNKILYITLSTGIGGGVVTNGMIDSNFEMFEPGQMLFNYGGKLKKWESFASGKALFEKYGRRAVDIDDKKIWQDYAKLIALGLVELLAIVQPELIIFGGGVGTYLEKFQKYLMEELNSVKNPLVPVPPIIKAKRPEEAVIYGCYEYLKANA